MFSGSRIRKINCLALVLLSLSTFSFAAPPEKAVLLSTIKDYHYESLKQYGESVLSPLLELYKEGDNSQKTKVVGALYYLSIKSEEAREVLMKDIHTPDKDLRLQVH